MLTPKFNTASSLSKLKSSPTFTSAATPKPPPTVKAPSVAADDAVVLETLTTPPELILIASVSLAEPSVPESGIIILVPKVDVEDVIASILLVEDLRIQKN